MIKNIVFDIGKVLVDYNWDNFFMSRFGNDAALVGRIKNALFSGNIWDEVDRGAIPDEELQKLFASRDPEIKDEILRAWDCMGEEVRPFPATNSWIIRLKQEGYGVYYLSNWSNRLLKNCQEALRFTELMDGGVFSCKIKIIKPEAEIYRTLLRNYGLQAEECIFLDDRPDNIEAAKSLGFQGIVVKSQQQAMEELDRILKEQNNK